MMFGKFQEGMESKIIFFKVRSFPPLAVWYFVNKWEWNWKSDNFRQVFLIVFLVCQNIFVKKKWTYQLEKPRIKRRKYFHMVVDFFINTIDRF